MGAVLHYRGVTPLHGNGFFLDELVESVENDFG